MKLKLALILLITLFLTVNITGYTGGGSVGTTECNDGIDNDGDGDTDSEDSGCTPPYEDDFSEGHIWDTDLTAVTQGGGPFDITATQSVFFQGSVNVEHEDQANTNTLTEQYIDDVYTGENYGSGDRREAELDSSNLPEGTVLLPDQNRVVDPPNRGEAPFFNPEIIGEEQTCGDGYHNENIQRTGDQINPGPETTDCRADYGRIKEMYDDVGKMETEGPYNHKGDVGMRCRNDEASCTASSCGASSCGSTCSDADCSFDPGGNKDYMEDNNFWNVDGEDIYREDCTPDSDNTVASAEGCNSGTNGCCRRDRYGNCADSGSSCSGSGDEEGDKRSWEETERRNCNDYNVVDGGGDLGGSESGEYGEEYSSKPDNDPAGTYTDFEAHYNDDGVDSGSVWCGYEDTLTVDADGPEGNSDGWVVIEGSNIVATESPDGSNRVGQRVRVINTDTGVSNFRTRFRSKIDTSCPDGKQVCLRYADFYTESGSGNLGDAPWRAPNTAVQVESTAYTTEDSYSVCKAINRINQKNGDGTSIIRCDYPTDPDDDTGTGSNNGPRPSACGDDSNEYIAYMEGPAVDEEVVSTQTIDYEACVDEISDCVLHGEEVSEGHVADVSPIGSDNQYEQGGNSPDREVCLNIDQGEVGGTGDQVDGDNRDDDHDGEVEENGGEWYSLDSETAQEYLRGNQDIITSGDQTDSNHIAYYWRENPNPHHDEYNPEGETEGIALEDDCGPKVEGCNKVDDTADKEPTFFNFIPRDNTEPQEGLNSIHYNPTGEDSEGSSNVRNSFFDPHGKLNKLQEDSNQLQPGMDTVYPGDRFLEGVDIWSNSIAGENEADMYALTEKLTWSISNSGNPYAPGSAPYHKDYREDNNDIREDKQDNTVSKADKVFGNSLADVNTEGQGIWIDPDDLKDRWDNRDWGKSEWTTWKDKLNFKNDLTGPDVGLGFDLPSKDIGSQEFDDGRNIVIADIYFQGETSTGNPYLEKSMCGDDQREYLLEEKGETIRSTIDSGGYACADGRDYCVQRDYENSVFETESYVQANEEGEDTGRLKQDDEYCMERTRDESPNWYDQDFNQEACRQNTLYGEEGIRWFSASDVRTHPHAFTGGIDDDVNNKLENQGEDTLTAKPEGGWNLDSGDTPVSSGTINTDRSVSTLGFCGGDDESEYLVTQTCTTRFCETDNSIQGVARDPDNCVLDRQQVESQDDVESVSTSADRDLYEQGDEVTIDTGSDTRTIACYGGQWHENWPVVFLRDKAEVPLGTNIQASFQIINVNDEASTFDLTLADGQDGEDLDALTTFEETGTDSMTVNVPASSSNTYNLEIKGNKILSPEEQTVYVEAETREESLSGEDQLNVEIVDNTANSVGNTTQQRRDVPGIGTTQIIWLTIVATTIYFFTLSRNL